MDTSVWWSGDLFSAMRTTLSADRSRDHLDAHAKSETITHHPLRAEHVVDFATRGGAKALGMDHLVGSLEKGKKADVVLIKNDASPAMYPILNPYGHVVFQAQRGDVHTVVVDGRVVKADGRLVDAGSLAKAKEEVGRTVEFLRSSMGDDVWTGGMNPDVPESKVLDNPYQYTDFASGSTHGQE
jgi:cytosine/adenosine deaminase-related metal-dependent hydrolase